MNNLPSAFDNDPEIEETVSSAYLSDMSEDELLQLRAEIDNLLPATAIQHLNLEQELVINYLATRSLMNRTLNDTRTQAGQKSQVITTCRGLLDSLVKSQTEVYDSERLKHMEYALVESIKNLPAEVQTDFFDIYQEKYARIREAYEQKERKK